MRAVLVPKRNPLTQIYLPIVTHGQSVTLWILVTEMMVLILPTDAELP
jgi:hypothetical protein